MILRYIFPSEKIFQYLIKILCLIKNLCKFHLIISTNQNNYRRKIFIPKIYIRGNPIEDMQLKYSFSIDL